MTLALLKLNQHRLLAISISSQFSQELPSNFNHFTKTVARLDASSIYPGFPCPHSQYLSPYCSSFQLTIQPDLSQFRTTIGREIILSGLKTG